MTFRNVTDWLGSKLETWQGASSPQQGSIPWRFADGNYANGKQSVSKADDHDSDLRVQVPWLPLISFVIPFVMSEMLEDDDLEIPEFMKPTPTCERKGCEAEVLPGAKKCLDHQVQEDFAWVLNEVEEILEKEK